MKTEIVTTKCFLYRREDTPTIIWEYLAANTSIKLSNTTIKFERSVNFSILEYTGLSNFNWTTHVYTMSIKIEKDIIHFIGEDASPNSRMVPLEEYQKLFDDHVTKVMRELIAGVLPQEFLVADIALRSNVTIEKACKWFQDITDKPITKDDWENAHTGLWRSKPIFSHLDKLKVLDAVKDAIYTEHKIAPIWDVNFDLQHNEA